MPGAGSLWQGDLVESAAPPLDDQAPHGQPAGATAAGTTAAERQGKAAARRSRPRFPKRVPLGVSRWLILWTTVLACGGYVAWRISDAYRFYQDDLLQFGVAQQSGLSWELISLNVFQHFAPVNRLAHLFLVRVADFSLVAGQALAVGLVLLFLASLVWLLHEVGASFAARLLAVIAAGLSITILDTAVWADASLHILPALVATNVVVAAHVRAVVSGRRRWHLVSVVFLALGVLTQERVLFALPLAVLVDWFVLGAGQPLRDRWRLLRSVLLPLTAMTVVAMAAGAYIYVNYAADGSSSRPSLATTARTALGAFTEGIGPPWVGIRLTRLAPLPVQFAILAGIVLLALLLVWVRRRNADGLLLIAASFLLYFGFLAFSPILQADYVDATALRLHNGTYLLVPTLVAVSTMRLRRRDEPQRDGVGRTRSRMWPALATALVLAAFLVVMGGRFTAAAWTEERAAHAYLDALGRTEAQWSDPGVTVIPLMAPSTVGRDWAEYYARQEFFLRFYDPGFVPQELGDRPVALDADGQPRPVRLVTEARMTGTGPATCGGPARTMLASDVEATGEPLFLQLTYRTDTAMEVQATSTEGLTPDAAAFGNWAVPLEPGERTVVIPLHSTGLSSVLIDWSEADAEHCVVEASVVRPVFADDGVCRSMDQYGRPTGVTPCPPRRTG